MKLNLTEEQILNAPVASGGGVFFCPEPDCHHPHLILVDDDNQPIAHFIIGVEFYAEIRMAMEQKTGVEINWPEKRFVLYGEIEAMYLEAVAQSQIPTKINRIRDPNAMAVALDNIGKIQLASR